jgi:hypothetical protein
MPFVITVEPPLLGERELDTEYERDKVGLAVTEVLCPFVLRVDGDGKVPLWRWRFWKGNEGSVNEGSVGEGGSGI